MDIVPGLKITSTELGWGGTMILLLLNLFKTQIGAILSRTLPAGFLNVFNQVMRRRADREEHNQEIQTAIIDSKLQTLATEQLRESWREEQYVEIIKELVGNKLDRLQTTGDKSVEILAGLHEQQTRTNDLLSMMNGTLTKLTDLLQEKRSDWSFRR